MANDALADAEFLHGRAFSLADAALCSALGYLDLRLTSEPWRERFPHVARYEKALATRPSVSATAPPR
jgi:glutathione S-transferase